MEADHLQPQSSCSEPSSEQKGETKEQEAERLKKRVKIVNQEKETDVTKRGLDDIGNLWLICRKCNQSKTDKDPIGWFTQNREFGYQFLKEIGLNDGSIPLSVCLNSKERKKINSKEIMKLSNNSVLCTVDYDSLDWIPRVSGDFGRVYVKPLLAIPDESEKNTLGMVFEFIAGENIAEVYPYIFLKFLSLIHGDNSEKLALEKATFEKIESFTNNSTTQLNCENEFGNVNFDLTIERLDGEIKLIVNRRKGDEFFSVTFKKGEEEPKVIFGDGIVKIIENPDDRAKRIYMNTIGFYRNLEDGVLCTKDGMKLGAKAVEYYLINHEKKIEQKKAAEIGVFLPLEAEIDDTDAEAYAYDKTYEPKELKKRVFATDKKTILLKQALQKENEKLFLSDSDNELSDEEKMEDFKEATQFILNKLKQEYSRLKTERKNRRSNAGAGSVQNHHSFFRVESGAVSGTQEAESDQQGNSQSSPHQGLFGNGTSFSTGTANTDTKRMLDHFGVES